MKRIVMLFALLLVPFIGYAADNPDRDEPIYIESDSLHIDDTKGVSIYRGNVHFRQGTANLWADELTIHSNARQELERVVALGRPARFKQDSEIPEENAAGQADRIEYQADIALVTLDKNAQFQQGENQFSGNKIVYKTDEKLVRAGKAVSEDNTGRVQIVIHPKKNTPDTEAAE